MRLFCATGLILSDPRTRKLEYSLKQLSKRSSSEASGSHQHGPGPAVNEVTTEYACFNLTSFQLLTLLAMQPCQAKYGAISTAPHLAVQWHFHENTVVLTFKMNLELLRTTHGMRLTSPAAQLV
jgi:hypothetical protein